MTERKVTESPKLTQNIDLLSLAIENSWAFSESEISAGVDVETRWNMLKHVETWYI